MQYDPKTPEEYMNMVEEDWKREKIEQLRRIILSNGTYLDEIINHKMLGYKDERGVVFHLNAQQDYVSLYVGDLSKIDPEGRWTEGLDTGKVCIRFKKTLSVFDTEIDRLIQRVLEMWKNGEEFDC
ncbi:MAG: DUF1801 domain-containing protein [Calditrichia bacterium]